MKRFQVRRSTDEDMQAIHAWLQEEESNGVEDNFLCNWNLTLRCHREKELFVCIDTQAGEPIAYHWGGLLSAGVLQVRASHRRMGIGRLMVESCIARAQRRSQMLLHIHCTPPTSRLFWTKMGFHIYDDEGHATRILSKRLPLPRQGVPVRVEIQLFPEARKWDAAIQPIRSIQPIAKRMPGGFVRLGERVAFLDRLAGVDEGDPVVRILVAGEERYCDKAKYEEARALGVRECRNGWYIDVIRP